MKGTARPPTPRLLHTPAFRQAERAGPDQQAGPKASAERSEGTMEARMGRESRSEARCAARQRDGGTPGRPNAWDRTNRCPSCAATAPARPPAATVPPAPHVAASWSGTRRHGWISRCFQDQSSRRRHLARAPAMRCSLPVPPCLHPARQSAEPP